MKVIVSSIVVLFVAMRLQVAPPERKPWEWTLEQRLALRSDSSAARERVSAARKNLKTRADQAKQETVVDSFTGSTHPELFLPTEVFDELMQLAFLLNPRMGDSFRKDMQPVVAQYGLPSDFWERLRTLSVIYMADVRRAYDNPNARNLPVQTDQREKAEFNRNYAMLCRSRAEALAKARAEFGAERFDRFLYGAIARNMYRTSFSPPDVDALRRAEEGCR